MNIIKKLLYIVIYITMNIITGCTDNNITESNDINDSKELFQTMQHAIFGSHEDFLNTLNAINEKHYAVASRATNGISLSDNEISFESLYEYNKQKFLSTLTQEQLDSIYNNEDELEFCLPDSIIADYHFAQLLNAEREIEIAGTVYKYLENGIAYTNPSNVMALKNIENTTQSIKITPQNLGTSMQLSGDVYFMPYDYTDIGLGPWDFGGPGNPGFPPVKPGNGNDNNNSVETVHSDEDGSIIISDNIRIPTDDIIEVDYREGGNGGIFHRVVTNFFGDDVIAQKDFSDGRKMVLSLYHQNLLVYSYIGTQVQMQKRVCGIWWNIKAEDMYLGWDTMTMKYTMPKSIINYFPYTFPNRTEYPTHAWNPFPYGKDKELLFTIPFINYDFTTENVNQAFNSAIKSAFNSAKSAIKNLVGNNINRTGLMAFDNRDIYIMTGNNVIKDADCKNIKKTFYSEWFPGSYQFGFSYDGNLNFESFEFDKNDNIDLYRASVFAAVKYKGKWLGARIIKKD